MEEHVVYIDGKRYLPEDVVYGITQDLLKESLRRSFIYLLYGISPMMHMDPEEMEARCHDFFIDITSNPLMDNSMPSINELCNIMESVVANKLKIGKP